MGDQQRQRLLPGKLIMSQVRPVNTAVCLEKLCESNYRKLFRLIPDLCCYNKKAVGFTATKPALHLAIIDRSAHTLTVELTHCFDSHLDRFSIVPAVKIRIYLDVQLAEVLRDHARLDVSKACPSPAECIEVRDYKWRLNYFLQKWLDHCLQHDYQFSELHRQPVIA